MIRNDAEHREALDRLAAERTRLRAHRRALREAGLSAAEIKRVCDPMTSFHRQLAEEVEAYERLSRGAFDAVRNLHGLGRLLVGLRIARGLSQRELAARLGVHESQVSRDERNEYHGITLDRAARVLDALEVEIETVVVDAGPERSEDAA